MKKILLTGANGQLGMEFRALALRSYFDLILTDLEELDISDEKSVQQFFVEQDFDYCINCAGYTAVDKAESDKEKAYLINSRAVKYLASACKTKDIPFIHFSTDYVYHGDKSTPFVETDPTNPQSVYAKSKLEGEFAALAEHVQTMVIRTSWLYSSYGHNFVKTMLRLGKEKEMLRVVCDQIGSPTYARDLVEAVLEILAKIEMGVYPKSSLSGIFHYSNEGLASWYDFTLAIFEICGIDCKVDPIYTPEYPTPAARPPFSLLNKRKIITTFACQIPHWRDSLKDCLQQLCG